MIKRNNILVNGINALSDLKGEIETMTETEKNDKIVNIAEDILEFNRQNQDEQPDTYRYV